MKPSELKIVADQLVKDFPSDEISVLVRDSTGSLRRPAIAGIMYYPLHGNAAMVLDCSAQTLLQRIAHIYWTGAK